jgi:hypothetical protein
MAAWPANAVMQANRTTARTFLIYTPPSKSSNDAERPGFCRSDGNEHDEDLRCGRFPGDPRALPDMPSVPIGKVA